MTGVARKRKRKGNEDEEQVKELVGMHIERVDAVTEPATRLPFLLIKSLDGKGPSLDELLQKAKGDGGADDGASSEREKLHEEQEARAKRYGIKPKPGGHLTPPKGYPEDPEDYGDPVNYAYPIDEEHIRPAVAYFNHDGMREKGGYTEEEWAIIGRRIAQAANRLLGDGYRYEDGKIVTPSSEEKDTRKEAGSVAETEAVAKQEEAPQLNGVPGSPDWENEDAALLRQAVQGLLAVKQILQKVLQRERVESTLDVNEVDEVSRLCEALDSLAELIGEVASAAALEEAEAAGDQGEVTVTASVEKIGRKISAANMDKIKTAMRHLANVAGCATIKEFADLYDTGAADEDASKAKGQGKTEDDEGGTAKARPKAKDENAAEQSDKQAETRKSADASDEHPEASAVMKALEATGLVELAKSAGTLLKAAEAIAQLEERVKRIEEQPLPGGPLLRGRATMSDYYLVRKGEEPVAGAQGAALESVLDQVTDPYLRDALSRELARALHPAHKGKE